MKSEEKDWERKRFRLFLYKDVALICRKMSNIFYCIKAELEV